MIRLTSDIKTKTQQQALRMDKIKAILFIGFKCSSISLNVKFRMRVEFADILKKRDKFNLFHPSLPLVNDPPPSTSGLPLVNRKIQPTLIKCIYHINHTCRELKILIKNCYELSRS